MLAALWNSVRQQTISKCFQKAGFLETQENLNEDNQEESPGICADVRYKTKVTFAFEEYVQADDNLPFCAVQDID
jgi:hypothetical protein